MEYVAQILFWFALFSLFVGFCTMASKKKDGAFTELRWEMPCMTFIVFLAAAVAKYLST